jgi:hypothetical protein
MSDVQRLSAALTGRYTVERELGRGGRAPVYLARDLKHDRNVAITALHPQIGAALGGRLAMPAAEGDMRRPGAWSHYSWPGCALGQTWRPQAVVFE